MATAMQKQIDDLAKMTVGQLKQKYLEVFGEQSRSNHKQFLFRRSLGASRRWPKAASPNARRAPKTMFGQDPRRAEGRENAEESELCSG